MKRILFVAALVFAAMSCNKTELNGDFSQPTENLIDFTLDGVKLSNKTVLAGEDGQILWVEGDAISVFDDSGSCTGHLFESELSEDRTWARFRGQIAEGSQSLNIVYPYDAAASCSGTTLTTTLPTTQTATPGSFANGAALAFASCSLGQYYIPTEDIIFEPLTAVLAFTMPSYIEGASSVVVSANNEAHIAGTVNVNTATAAISSVSGSNSVTVAVNELTAGSTYYVSIAPGTYEGGFSFRVTTKAGNVYTASTTRTLPADAGQIYPLGTLGLTLSVTPSVTITHTQNSSGELNGSTAVLSIPTLPSEFASLVTGWSVELQRDGVAYRRLSATSGTMSVANGWTYLPQGSYDIVANYTLTNGKVKTLRATTTSPSPVSKMSASVSGYCSYDYYVGNNGCSKNVSTANSLDNATIYAPSVKVNVDSELLADGRYSKNIFYSWDSGTGVSFSGNSVSFSNRGGQSWTAHTLSVNCTFDGASVSASRTFHITGLPFIDNDPTDDYWSLSNNAFVMNGSYIQLGGGTGKANATINRAFHCPSSINVSVSTDFMFSKNGWIAWAFKVNVGGSEIINVRRSGFDTGKVNYSESANASMSSSNNTVRMSSGYETAGYDYVEVSTFKIYYR